MAYVVGGGPVFHGPVPAPIPAVPQHPLDIPVPPNIGGPVNGGVPIDIGRFFGSPAPVASPHPGGPVFNPGPLFNPGPVFNPGPLFNPGPVFNGGVPQPPVRVSVGPLDNPNVPIDNFLHNFIATHPGAGQVHGSLADYLNQPSGLAAGGTPASGMVSQSVSPDYRYSDNIAGDHAHATGVANHLQDALAAVRDPELKQNLSNALSTILKHLSGLQKEHQQALAGKLSPRLLQEAYSTGPQIRARSLGNEPRFHSNL